MNMTIEFNIERLFPLLIAAINRVGDKFERNKALIISESDLKCQIYSELRYFVEENSQTSDSEIFGSPLHS